MIFEFLGEMVGEALAEAAFSAGLNAVGRSLAAKNKAQAERRQRWKERIGLAILIIWLGGALTVLLGSFIGSLFD